MDIPQAMQYLANNPDLAVLMMGAIGLLIMFEGWREMRKGRRHV